MARLVFISPYLKGGKDGTHLANLTKYAATREGAEILRDETSQLPATRKQRDLIEQLVKDIPESAELLEYEDFKESGTRGDASEFIAQALEQSPLDKRENYLDYISHRPGVQMWGEHGLFSSEGKVPVLSKVVDEVSNHPGNVWTPVVSLRRKDAERLGYDNAANWQALITSLLPELAQGYKIPLKDLRWYGAFHNKEKHVHVHMIIFSSDPKEGFLSKQGIRKVKSAFAKRIFRQEMISVYQRQTEYRDLLGRSAEERMADLIRQMQTRTVNDTKLEQLVSDLAERLQFVKGKKVYGYLPPRIKSLVDEIVDVLAKDKRVAAAYELWQEMREEVCRTYSDTLPERLPLSAQKEFKQVRNMVIREALKLGGTDLALDDPALDDEQEPLDLPDEEPPAEEALPPEDVPPDEADARPHVEWSDNYIAAKRFLFGSDDCEQDFEKAFLLFQEEAEKGNALAMFDLGRMYADGLGRDADSDEANLWYAQALDAFESAEDEKASRYLEYRIGKMYAAGLGTAQDFYTAADWLTLSANQNYKYAQYSLAGLYRRGQGVDQDDGEAFRLYQKSAAQKFPYASYELGKMLRDGIGCEKDEALSKKHFSNAFQGFLKLEKDSHDDKLQYRIGAMLLHGVGVAADKAEARKWFEKASRLGNPYAQYQLAKLILADKAADSQQLAQAVEWLTKSAEAGQDCAQYALGKLYRDGTAVPKDIPKAMEYFTLAAEQKNSYAAYALGKLLLDGKELPKDVGTAVKWLSRSAGLGNQFAQYRLGKLYLKGEDVPKDVSAAVKYLTASAKQGNQYAQYLLGKLYLKGDEVPKDISAAVEYLTASAKQGNQFAQYALGKLFFWGKEVPKDMELAAFWLTRSAEQGNPYALWLLQRRWQTNTSPAGMAVVRLFWHMGRIFADNSATGAAGNGMRIDRKLRSKIKEKKIALGQRPDDQEQQNTMDMRL